MTTSPWQTSTTDHTTSTNHGATRFSTSTISITSVYTSTLSNGATTVVSTVIPTGTLVPQPDSEWNSLRRDPGAIAGIAIGVVVAVGLLAAWVFILFRRHRTRKLEGSALDDGGPISRGPLADETDDFPSAAGSMQELPGPPVMVASDSGHGARVRGGDEMYSDEGGSSEAHMAAGRRSSAALLSGSPVMVPVQSPVMLPVSPAMLPSQAPGIMPVSPVMLPTRSPSLLPVQTSPVLGPVAYPDVGSQRSRVGSLGKRKSSASGLDPAVWLGGMAYGGNKSRPDSVTAPLPTGTSATFGLSDLSSVGHGTTDDHELLMSPMYQSGGESLDEFGAGPSSVGHGTSSVGHGMAAGRSSSSHGGHSSGHERGYTPSTQSHSGPSQESAARKLTSARASLSGGPPSSYPYRDERESQSHPPTRSTSPIAFLSRSLRFKGRRASQSSQALLDRDDSPESESQRASVIMPTFFQPPPELVESPPPKPQRPAATPLFSRVPTRIARPVHPGTIPDLATLVGEEQARAEWPRPNPSLTLPPLPSPAITDQSSLREGLLRLGGQGMYSSGALSFQDEVDYSRPIGGVINNRMYSTTTFTSVDTTGTAETTDSQNVTDRHIHEQLPSGGPTLHTDSEHS
ncbi:hypothetical protein OE88DRAFT_1738557 [Heliocybe sulcata]|uniref:Uncharacterized protein n=1 Tax=Heliocybe sulcata TaxID=5364 RepID=A0A5C3MQU8_9AGAM|nr:hypothetical protein OE88DRAFT_1738557 [Heliocybe sulcata]